MGCFFSSSPISDFLQVSQPELGLYRFMDFRKCKEGVGRAGVILLQCSEGRGLLGAH